MTLQKTPKRKASNKALEASKSFPKGDSLPMEKNINTGDILPDNALGNLAKLADSSLSFSEVVVRLKNLDPETFKKGLQALSKDIHSKDDTLAEKEIEAALKGIRGALIEESRFKYPYESTPKPWPEDVQIGDVVKEIENIIRRVLYIRPDCITAVAYFCLASWFVEYLDYAPYMVITSPTKRCGKSTLIELMLNLVRRPYTLSGKPSEPALFRIIQKNEPTILVDEVDTFLKNCPELQGLLNGGTKRALAFIPRCDTSTKGNIYVKNYSTFGFKVFSGISANGVGAALVDRAIVIPMERVKNDDELGFLDDIEPHNWENLQRKMHRLSIQYGEYLQTLKGEKRTSMPKSLDSRSRDKWRTLFALADIAGEDEGRRVRNVAVSLCATPTETSSDIQLLADAGAIVEKASIEGGYTLSDGCINFRVSVGVDSSSGEYILSDVLHQALILDKEKQWHEQKGGRALTKNHMSKTLKKFDIASKNIRSQNNKKGFQTINIIEARNLYANGVEPD